MLSVPMTARCLTKFADDVEPPDIPNHLWIGNLKWMRPTPFGAVM